LQQVPVWHRRAPARHSFPLGVLVPSWCNFKTISTQSRSLLLVKRGGPLRLGEKPGLTQASDVRSETGLSRGFSLTIENWPEWLAEEGDIEAEDRIRRQTHTGRPCGATAFLDQLESLLHRTVRLENFKNRDCTKRVTQDA
jgi:hypothetical protein